MHRIAGKPGEFLYEKNLPKDYKSSPAKFQEYLWNVASAGPFFGADIASIPGAYVDEIAEQWTQPIRQELQGNWGNRGW